MIRPSPRTTLFPYTTLFRSEEESSLRRFLGRPSRITRRCSERKRSEEHTSELQSRENLVCRLLLEKNNIGMIEHVGDEMLSEYFAQAFKLLRWGGVFMIFFFFFNDTATTEIYTLSLHDALPISFLPRAGVAAGPAEAIPG